MSNTKIISNKPLILSEDSSSISENNQTEENRSMCRLLKIHFSNFFDNIYIPFNFFRKECWDIRYVLDNNADSLFYNEKYMNEENKTKFEKTYKKYADMIEEIMSPGNKLAVFLKKWTDMTGISWKAKSINSYLKSILTNSRYEFISPLHITEIYCEYSNKYRDNSELIQNKMIKYVDKIRKKMRQSINLFKKEFEKNINDYVYKYPLIENKNFSKKFINILIKSIIIFSKKMIKLNIYCIHTIVNDIICFLIPLEEINNYDINEYHNRKIIVI